MFKKRQDYKIKINIIMCNLCKHVLLTGCGWFDFRCSCHNISCHDLICYFTSSFRQIDTHHN